MAAENESPARDALTPSLRGRGRGRGGRGRGRGGGRGASNINVTKVTSTRGGRGGTRRGRAKNFTDSRVQAAYERQRDLKATYQAVAHALKPALQELAERSIDDILQNPDKYKDTEYYFPVISQLRSNLEKRLAEHQNRFDCDMKLAGSTYDAERYVIEQEFKVCLFFSMNRSCISLGVMLPSCGGSEVSHRLNLINRTEFRISMKYSTKVRRIALAFFLHCIPRAFQSM